MKLNLRKSASMLLALAATPFAHAATAVTDWSSKLLTNVNTVSNEVYFWPGDGSEPNILSTGSTGNWLLQSGGPIAWTASEVQPDGITRSGEFFPGQPVGSVLLNFSSGSLIAVIFTGASPTQTLVDSDITAVRGMSCTSDATGNLYVAYGFTRGGNEYLGYATKPPTGGWTVSYRLTAIPVTGTAVYPSSLTSAKIFFTQVTGSQSVLATSTVTSGVISQPSTLDGGGLGPIAVVKVGLAPHFIYCRWGDTSGSTYLIRDLNPASGSITTLGTLPPANPVTRGIRAAVGADGKIRVAIFEATSGVIYYLKASDASFGKVVDLSGALGNADLRGLTFTSDGTPCVLYRKTMTESYVAFPKDLDDADGNGRIDLMDTALRASTGAVTTPAVDQAVDGVADSAGKFKLQFPVVGTPTISTSTLKNTGQNLSYALQTSSDMKTWATPTTGFKFTLAGAANQKVATCLFSDPVPGTTTKKFARIVVSRITDEF